MAVDIAVRIRIIIIAADTAHIRTTAAFVHMRMKIRTITAADTAHIRIQTGFAHMRQQSAKQLSERFKEH